MKRHWRPSDENSAPQSGSRARSMDRNSHIPRPLVTPKPPGSRSSSGSGGVGGLNRFSRNRPSETQGSLKRSVSLGRQSLATGPSRMRSATTISGVGHVRHSSGGLPSNKPLTDSRNLSDRSIRTQCGREIHQFLMVNHYPNQIQAKDLIQGPSSTEFWKVFEFLYRIVDEDFKFSPADDKPQIFLDSIKTIGYPFNISNSHLKTIGSPHSWPYLLGVLHWMLSPISAMFEFDAESVLMSKEASPL